MTVTIPLPALIAVAVGLVVGLAAITAIAVTSMWRQAADRREAWLRERRNRPTIRVRWAWNR